MKYLCLLYLDEGEMNALPTEDVDALVTEATSYLTSLQASGHFVAAARLKSSASATTVRVRNGKRMITDGPFAETKEQLAGFILIQAGSHDEALEIATTCPGARYGCFEVRPIEEGLNEERRYT